MSTYTLQQVQNLEGEDRFAAYSALDATGTREIYDLLRPRLAPNQERIYRWSIAQIGPAATMTRRGIRVDELAREELAREMSREKTRAVREVQKHPFCALWDGKETESGSCKKSSRKDGRHTWPRGVPEEERTCSSCGTPRIRPAPFSPTSPQQVAHLLYDILHVPVHGNKTSDRSVDSEAMEAIKREGVAYKVQGTGRRVKSPLENLDAFCDAILDVKDFEKKLGFLRCPLRNGRFHASFNVFYPWTGRWSSSEDPFGHGSNAQNITEQFRHLFIADPGYEMFYADLKTAESLLVAYLSGDENYIEAHKGDVHTYVARLLWPDLPWNGDIFKDKKVASSMLPPWDPVPGHDFRYQAKRIQHGTNFGLTPYGIAIIAHIPRDVAFEAQRAFFNTFPMVREYQNLTRAQAEASEPIVNPFGRSALLFGRPWDEHTYKQALAFRPQSSVGDVLNQGLWRVWRDLDPEKVHCLAQAHDAVLGQFPAKIGLRDILVQEIVSRMTIPFPVTDIRGKTRECTIPVEFARGKNWGKRNLDPEKGRLNPEGLEELKC